MRPVGPCYNRIHAYRYSRASDYFTNKQQNNGMADATTCSAHDSFGDVFQTYARGQADAIVVAVENTIYGTINETYRHIESCSAPIVGEVTLTIQQTLITSPGTKLEDITFVYSHPVALSQCHQFLQEHLPQAAQIEYFDTAGAVEFIKQQGSSRLAAIAGETAAQLYNMLILKRHIHDGQDNITRFLVP